MPRTTNRSSIQTTPRHVWLAALGAAAIARRETLAAIGHGLSQSARLRAGAIQAAIDTRDIVRGAVMTLEEQLRPQLRRIGNRANALLSPLLDRAAAQPARRKTPRRARTAARTANKAPRSAGARKQAATRLARKGRG